MRMDSLEELATAFQEWRDGRQGPKELIPEALIKRARLAMGHHGATRVVKAVKVSHDRLTKGPRPRKGAAVSSETTGPGRDPLTLESLPRYSRIEVPKPNIINRALAEIETPGGIKVKIYEVTPEILSMLTGMTSSRGAV